MGRYEYYTSYDGHIFCLDTVGGRAIWFTGEWFPVNPIDARQSIMDSTFWEGRLLGKFDSLDNPIEVLYG